MRRSFLTGIENLVYNKSQWLKGKKIALLSHPPALTSDGLHSAELLYRRFGKNLVALFGPEHGFFGTGGPGVPLETERHLDFKIPIYSLYGACRKPTPEMLAGLDVIIVDLQDIGARCYTFGTTLRYILEAAQQNDIEVIVADRPIPLPNIVDGPMLELDENFVAALPVPMCYGMTPAELALFLKMKFRMEVKLRVATMKNYHRTPYRNASWFEWVPPSTAIRSWEAGWCYLATVFSEAVVSVDVDRQGNMAFRVFGADWMESRKVCNALNRLKLDGVSFHPFPYYSVALKQRINGIRISVNEPDNFYPVKTSIAIIATLQKLYGKKRLWDIPEEKKRWFDILYGTTCVREAIEKNQSICQIASTWRLKLRKFQRERALCLLYSVTEH